ncbi:glycosyl hydrolase [Cellulomonas sp. KRMCY2]|uniref:glycosyl hydrolase n=1 Tax=Cellulomonas sp. KRMCY2 TaxID=1304865 RepID=UPI00045E693A|nr:glycosyl hydrolase [Cellulomonas sp. KRMCY2]
MTGRSTGRSTGRRRMVLIGSVGTVGTVGVIAVLLAASALRLGHSGGVISDGGPTDSPSGSPIGTVAGDGTADGPPDAPLPEVDTDGLVGAIHHAAAAKVDPARLAPGLVPPTNRWFSGLVFGDEPQPVFPLPLSAALTGSGFSLGVPEPVTSAAAIVGPHQPALTVDVAAGGVRVGAYDAASVTVELLGDDGQAGAAVLGRLLLAEGSPFVSLTADESGPGLSMTVDAVFEPTPDGPASATAVISGREWALVVPDGSITDTGGLRLAAGQSATWYPLPDEPGSSSGPSGSAAEVLARAAADQVVGTEVSYGVGEGHARTTIAYRTRTGQPTAVVTMPHHRTGEQPDRDGCGLGSYPSVHGTLELCAGSILTSWAPVIEPAGSLDLSAVPADRRAAVVEQLRLDVVATPAFPSDTYFGGKALYRAATLVALGRELGADDVVAPLREQVEAALREWTEPDGCARRDARCFVYDEAARGVVGLTPSFGSDEFNDHHFHYGYLLAAAGILAADDPALARDLAPVMDLLAQDIAAARPGPWFPQLRVFDVYAGHSWASGTVPFADANNQESSSEAVNAWNGLGLWAQATGQAELVTEATWLASTEAASARTYWTDLDLDDPLYDGFEHQVVSLVWGGKRDYATWFSAEPNAMLGILLIPMGPVSQYLAGDPAGIRERVAEAAPDGYGVQFGDYLLMYLALAGRQDAEQAWQAAAGLPDTAIDDGSSRAYLMAWLAQHAAAATG